MMNWTSKLIDKFKLNKSRHWNVETHLCKYSKLQCKYKTTKIIGDKNKKGRSLFKIITMIIMYKYDEKSCC